MNFQLTDDQKLIQETLTRFLGDRYDLTRRREYLALPDGFSRDSWLELAELGVIGLALPTDLGGLGGTAVDTMVVMEQVGYHAAVEPFAAAFAIGTALAFADDRVMAAQIAEAVMGGSCVVVPAMLENRQSFAESHSTTSRPTSDGHRLDGTKRIVPFPSAGMFLIDARQEGVSAVRNQQLFVVPAETPGLSRLRYSAIDGTGACDLRLENAAVSRDALLVDTGNGAAAIDSTAAILAFAGAAEAVGILRRLVETTRDYLKTRVQFGKPLVSKQVVRHRLAEMYMHSELARSAVIGAAVRQANLGEWYRGIAAAKVTVAAAADFIGKQSVQLHGGMGVSDELDVSHAYKRLMMLKFVHGDPRSYALHLGEIAA